MTKKRNQPEEKLVIRPILAKLETYKMTGDVIWYCRLEAEDAPGIPAGTPDIVVVVNCGNGIISVLFLECKRPKKKKASRDDLRFEQLLFFQKMDGKPKTICCVINNPKNLYEAIKKARNL